MNMLQKKLNNHDGVIDYYQKCISIARTQKEIVVFGVGRGGRNVYKLLKTNGLKNIKAFCDNNIAKQGEKFAEFEILSPREAAVRYQDACFVISCVDNVNVKKQLLSLGIPESYIKTFDLTWCDFEQTDFNYIMQHIDEFNEAYEMMADNISKNVFIDLLNYKMTRDKKYVQKAYNSLEIQYFDTFVPFSQGQVFVDVGSYTGDTTENYIKWSKGKYGKIICFEANKDNFERLNQNIEKNKWSNIKTYCMGISDQKSLLSFNTVSAGGGYLTETGENKIEVDSLDHMLNERVDFIKMDIEGAEYNALIGAQEIIKMYKPILAFCVYHKKDDFFKLTHLVKTICPEYKFYLRHYSLTEGETVCYAII